MLCVRSKDLALCGEHDRSLALGMVVVADLCSHGTCRYGLCSYALYSYGLCSYGSHSYGLNSYGSYGHGRQDRATDVFLSVAPGPHRRRTFVFCWSTSTTNFCVFLVHIDDEHLCFPGPHRRRTFVSSWSTSTTNLRFRQRFPLQYDGV